MRQFFAVFPVKSRTGGNKKVHQFFLFRIFRIRHGKCRDTGRYFFRCFFRYASTSSVFLAARRFLEDKLLKCLNLTFFSDSFSICVFTESSSSLQKSLEIIPPTRILKCVPSFMNISKALSTMALRYPSEPKSMREINPT